MSIKVNLTKKVVTAEGKRFCPVMFSANGSVKPDWVIVGGSPERHPEGRYYIDWNKDGTRHRQSVGTIPAQAVARQLRKETELKAASQGIALVPQSELDRRRSIDAAIASYLEDTELSKKPKTLSAYTTSLAYFRESCDKTYIEEIERKDMLKFAAFLRDKKKQAPRTCWNKFCNVASFLKAYGVRNMIKKGDWPTYVEEEPEIYEPEDLDNFLSVCYADERLWFEFFLMTGMREQEVIYCTWRNINFKQSTVSMRWNPEYDWKPKGNKEREIPFPTRLLEALQAAQPEKSKRGLLFPTSTGAPKLDFLDECKAIATRANLDPDDFWLHKFRATFATRHLQNGVDLRTVQLWLGHTDLASTLRYLRPARGAGVREKVNATFA